MNAIDHLNIPNRCQTARDFHLLHFPLAVCIMYALLLYHAIVIFLNHLTNDLIAGEAETQVLLHEPAGQIHCNVRGAVKKLGEFEQWTGQF